MSEWLGMKLDTTRGLHRHKPPNMGYLGRQSAEYVGLAQQCFYSLLAYPFPYLIECWAWIFKA